MKRVAIVVLSYACLTACESGVSRDAGISVVDSAGVEIVVSASPGWAPDQSWRLEDAPSVRIGAVEGDEEYLFDRIMGAVPLSDGRIVVADMGSSQARFFTSEGRYLISVGASGEGPGEFRQITGIYRLQNDIVAVEDRLERVHFFGPDGSYRNVIQTGRMPISVDPVSFHENPPTGVRIVGWLDDGSIIGWESTQVRLSDSRQLEEAQTLELVFSRFEADGTVAREGVRIPGATVHPHPMNLVLPEVFGSAVYPATSGAALVMGMAGPGELRWYDRDGRLQKVARRSWPARPVTSDMVEEYVRRSSPPLREDMARGRTFAQLLPAFSALLVDAGGHIWVRSYEVSHGATTLQYQRTFEDPSTWFVFDPTGRWLGEVAMPSLFSALAIGEDYVLGIRRDELDVEYVEVFGLVKPAP